MANEHEHRDSGAHDTGRAGDEHPSGADRMDDREHPAQPEQTQHGFEEGFDQKPDSPEEDDVGRFSTGIEQTPEHAEEKEQIGRFSEGIEQTPETAEKTAEGDFSTGSEQIPDQH